MLYKRNCLKPEYLFLATTEFFEHDANFIKTGFSKDNANNVQGLPT